MSDDSAKSSGKVGIDELPLPTAPDLDHNPSAKAYAPIVKGLRVKRIVDLDEPVLPDRGPNTADPGDVEEIHREVRKALRDEDDRKLGKIFEDVLDPLQNSESRSHDKTPEELAEAATLDFEAALASELRRFTQQVRGWGASYKLSTADKTKTLVIRLKSPTPYSATFDVEYDDKMVRKFLRNRNYDGAATGVAMAEMAIARVRGQLLISR
jgi:hypothetical protein